MADHYHASGDCGKGLPNGRPERPARQPSVEIDKDLMNRQIYVLGEAAMKQIGKASVLILGLRGLGVEIAKNLILGGVREVCLWDNQSSQWADLAGNFYITEDDVKNQVPRVKACIARLRELNPAVAVKEFPGELSAQDIESMRQFNCVIATEVPLSIRVAISKSLRAALPHIPFICGDAYGILTGAFCDFGASFLVHDPRTEEGRELLITNITQDENGQVTCSEGYLHQLEVGDLVEFKNVQGMAELNTRTFPVEKIVSPVIFCIGNTTGYGSYEGDGIAKQAPKPKTMSFEPLEVSLEKPALLDCDLGRPNGARDAHLAWRTLVQFLDKHARLPAPSDLAEAEAIAAGVAKNMEMTDVDTVFLKQVFLSATGQFNPLTAAMGGILAQEAMKALTGKFSPLQQWLYVDAREVFAPDSSQKGDRFDGIRMCVGDKCFEQLRNLNLFMVGCGAIGCETLKNLALIGACCGTRGQLHITDDDHIEKSNLSRQFLFRSEHIGKSKSEVGAQCVKHINPYLNVTPHLLRVSPATQAAPFSDEFFHHQDIVVNALDNVQARIYMDQRCVTNARPLLDSGTLGTKGHVQVIIPYLSESYGTQRDPGENAGDSIPFCTLKSFPALIEHCIEWAREKFHSSFSGKPDSFNTFWQLHGPGVGEVVRSLMVKARLDGVSVVYKLTIARPKSFQDVVQIARNKFEKYFNFKALQLLSMFPIDHVVEGGVRFWQQPKRYPAPVLFNVENALHMDFIRAACVLYSRIYGIEISAADLSSQTLKAAMKFVRVPLFVAKGKEIVTDEAAHAAPSLYDSSDAIQLAKCIKSSLEKGDCTVDSRMCMHPEVFEKDDDRNAHIDFIYAAANLRADMYRIDNADRDRVKRIAGRIVPAIATTTACVAGLATLELVKLAQDLSKMKPETKHLLNAKTLERYKNTFLNLALPVMYFSEPGAVSRVTLPGGISVTLWDQWTITGSHLFTLQDFINAVKAKYDLVVSSILLGSKMVYMPFMPQHHKRLPLPFNNFLDLPNAENYVDLSVDMEHDEPDDMNGVPHVILWPSIRYFFR